MIVLSCLSIADDCLELLEPQGSMSFLLAALNFVFWLTVMDPGHLQFQGAKENYFLQPELLQ